MNISLDPFTEYKYIITEGTILYRTDTLLL